MPMAEHWAVESVVSGGSLILKRRFQKRTLQLCGLNNLTPDAKSYVEKKVKHPETIPVIFTGKDQQGKWYGDIWVSTGNDYKESITGLLLLSGLAELSEDYYNCPNGDSFELAENLARERKSGIWGRK